MVYINAAQDEMQEIIIRPYQSKDRAFVRAIAYDTALLGDSAHLFFEGEEIISDFLTNYFVDYEPCSCFIAEMDGTPAGYLLGAKDISVLNKVSGSKIIPRLLLKAIARNVIFNKKNLILIVNCMKSLLKGEFKSPDFSEVYPAVLHINIQKGYRNQGIGTMLITAYLDYLVKEKIKGVHFATLSDRAARFYDKLGFVLLYKSKRSYLRNILRKDIFCYIYGKKLELL